MKHMYKDLPHTRAPSHTHTHTHQTAHSIHFLFYLRHIISNELFNRDSQSLLHNTITLSCLGGGTPSLCLTQTHAVKICPFISLSLALSLSLSLCFSPPTKSLSTSIFLYSNRHFSLSLTRNFPPFHSLNHRRRKCDVCALIFERKTLIITSNGRTLQLSLITTSKCP